ncbi:MAG: biotin--[acetyl-CoA-carboxylase] ligase [Mucinivorans sp.]
MEYQIFDFDEVTSTNDLAADLIYSHGAVVVAAVQSAGRGQRGNRWESVRGENLMFSLVVCPTHVEVCHQFLLSMITALAVRDALSDFGIEARVKWPNDIYVGERKICGILIEHSFSSHMLSRTIIGVGVNVMQRDFDPSAGNPVSLAALGVKATPREVLARFCARFSQFYAQTFVPNDIEKQYMASLYRGQGYFPYQDTATNERFEACVAAIDPHSGQLTLRTKNNEQRSYYFKEVEFLRD